MFCLDCCQGAQPSGVFNA